MKADGRSEALVHDVSYETTRRLMEIVGCLVREECQRDLFDSLYDVVKTGVEVFQVKQNRMLSRLNPFRN